MPVPVPPIAWIDDAGFHRLRLDELVALVSTIYQGIYGSDIDIDDDTKDGEQIGAWCEIASNIVQLAEGVYDGRSRAGAMGTGLSRLMQLVGILRKKAEYTTVTATLGGSPGTTILAGSLAQTSASPPVTVATIADVTIGAGGTATATLRATVVGPLKVPAGTLVKKVTVISGWDTITNDADGTPGRYYEQDQDARVRMAQSVALPSQGLTDAMRAALLNLTDVTGAEVFENDTDAVNALGMPRHSVWAVVDGGDPGDIAQAIWRYKGQGCTLYGSLTQSTLDSQGVTHAIKYDRPADVPIYVTVQLSAAVGSDVADAIRTQIAGSVADGIPGFGPSTFGIGKLVQWFKMSVPINAAAPDVDVVAVFIGTAPAPTGQADIPILPTQISRWDVSRIVVTT